MRGGVRFRNINVDSTFIFAIYDTEKKISLFIGRIDNPSSKEVENTILSLHSNDKEIEEEKEEDEMKVNNDEIKEKDDEIKIDTTCSGGNLETCILEVCNFESVTTQKLCIKNCEIKCKTT